MASLIPFPSLPLQDHLLLHRPGRLDPRGRRARRVLRHEPPRHDRLDFTSSAHGCSQERHAGSLTRPVPQASPSPSLYARPLVPCLHIAAAQLHRACAHTAHPQPGVFQHLTPRARCGAQQKKYMQCMLPEPRCRPCVMSGCV